MCLKEESDMKKVFIIVTVFVITAMLITGCNTPEKSVPASAPDLTSPATSGSSEMPGTDKTQITPSATSSPEPTNGGTLTPIQTTQEPVTGSPTGTIQVLVTDAPNHNVHSVNLTVSKVEVHKAGGDETPSSWMSLNVTHDKPFNLLELQNGLTMLLADGEIEAGKYTQLRMTVFEVIVDYDDVVGAQAEVPSGKLKFVRPFTLAASDNITILVDIDAAKSVIVTGGTKPEKTKVLFKPVVKLQVVSEGEPGMSAPAVQTYNPADNATGVALDTNLVLTFDDNMVKGSGNITIKKYLDDSIFETIDVNSANVTISGNEVTIDPAGTFEDNTGYYVIIDEDALINDNGHGYAGINDKDTWNFTAAEIIPLTIDGGTLAADNSYINVAFNEGVHGDSLGSLPVESFDFNLIFDQNGGNATSAMISSVNNTLGGALTGGESIIRIYMSITGTPSGVETIEVKPQDSSIYNIDSDAAAITETTGTKILNDQLAPAVQTYSPADDTTGVSQNAILLLIFDDNMVKGTGNITIKRYSDNSTFEIIAVTSSNVTISGTNVTIDPSDIFEDNTGYYIVIDEGALADDVGNSFEGIANKDTWNFTT
jgi:hypothetical protein